MFTPREVKGRLPTYCLMIRDDDLGKWRCDVAGKMTGTTTTPTYTGPSPRVSKGLGIETSSPMPPRENSPTRERTVVEAGDGEVSERRKRDDEDEKYEVVVDEHPFEVTQQRERSAAFASHVRQETFHRQLNLAQLNQLRSALEEDHQRQQSNWQLIMQAKEEHENDVRTMMPAEQDWDREFAINPNEAHQHRVQGLYGALARSQQASAVRWRKSTCRKRIDGFRNTR